MIGNQQIILVATFLLLGLVGISTFSRSRNKNTRLQAIRSMITGVGAIICLVSLFSYWIEYKGIPYAQVGIAGLWDIGLMQVVVYTMIFLVVLQYFGSFIYAVGLKAGKGLISRSFSFFLTMCVIIIIGFSVVPGVRFVGFAPWIAIFGSIIGRTALEVPQEEEEEDEEDLKGECPKCGDPVKLEDSFCSSCGKALDLEDKFSE